MIKRFFNKRYTVKKLGTGHVRRFTATATVDGHLQQSSEPTELLQADYGSTYIGYFNTDDPIREGRKIIENGTSIEYIVESVTVVDHPVTNTSYLEVILLKDQSKQDGSVNQND